jgi:hypothetical protein
MSEANQKTKQTLELAAYAVIAIAALGVAIWYGRPTSSITTVPGRRTSSPALASETQRNGSDTPGRWSLPSSEAVTIARRARRFTDAWLR